MYWASTNSIPETVTRADGIIETNLRWAGIDNPPLFLATAAADNIFAAVSAVLLLLGAVALISWYLERRRMKKQTSKNRAPTEAERVPAGIRIEPGAREIWIDGCTIDGFEVGIHNSGEEVSITKTKIVR